MKISVQNIGVQNKLIFKRLQLYAKAEKRFQTEFCSIDKPFRSVIRFASLVQDALVDWGSR